MVIETNRQLLLVAQAKGGSSSVPLTFSTQAIPPSSEIKKSAALLSTNKTALYDPQSGVLDLSKIGKAVGGSSAIPNRPVSALSQSLLSQSTSQQQPQSTSYNHSFPDRMQNKLMGHSSTASFVSQDLQR